MRDILLDIIRQIPNSIETIGVFGTDETTTVKAHDANQTFIMEAKFKEPVDFLKGEFGISNLKLLSGLLNFSNYKTEDAVITAKNLTRNGKTFVEKIEFRNPKTGNDADFRLISPDLIGEHATISTIPWNISFAPDRSKLTEFTQLANLYSDIDKKFGVKTINEDQLQFYIGNDNSSTHKASMIFKSELAFKTPITSELMFDTSQFLSLISLMTSNKTVFSITSRGLFLVSVETAYAQYDYYLRGIK